MGAFATVLMKDEHRKVDGGAGPIPINLFEAPGGAGPAGSPNPVAYGPSMPEGPPPSPQAKESVVEQIPIKKPSRKKQRRKRPRPKVKTPKKVPTPPKKQPLATRDPDSVEKKPTPPPTESRTEDQPTAANNTPQRTRDDAGGSTGQENATGASGGTSGATGRPGGSGSGNGKGTGSGHGHGRGHGNLAPKPRNVPAHKLKQLLVHKVDFKIPPGVLDKHRGETLRIAVLMCIEQSGRVDVARTRILAGVPGANSVVLRALRQWRYKPQPLPLCAPVHFKVEVVD